MTDSEAQKRKELENFAETNSLTPGEAAKVLGSGKDLAMAQRDSKAEMLMAGNVEKALN